MIYMDTMLEDKLYLQPLCRLATNFAISGTNGRHSCFEVELLFTSSINHNLYFGGTGKRIDKKRSSRTFASNYGVTQVGQVATNLVCPSGQWLSQQQSNVSSSTHCAAHKQVKYTEEGNEDQRDQR